MFLLSASLHVPTTVGIIVVVNSDPFISCVYSICIVGCLKWKSDNSLQDISGVYQNYLRHIKGFYSRQWYIKTIILCYKKKKNSNFYLNWKMMNFLSFLLFQYLNLSLFKIYLMPKKTFWVDFWGKSISCFDY